MGSRHAEVNGIRMHWEEHGTGRPVVLIHGIPTSARLWRHVLPRLHGVCGLAWEMVGYGQSIEQGRGRDISVARQTEYLAAWMRARGLARAIMVGHDLGGGVIQRLAVFHRHLVAGLVLTDDVCYDNWPVLEARLLRAANAILERSPSVLVAPLIGVLMYRGHSSIERARESFNNHWPPYARAGGGAALSRQLCSLNVADTLSIADQLPNLELPARVVWGTDDPWLHIGYGYRLARDLGARLDRVEGGRHFIPEDQPDRIVNAVHELRDVLAANAP